MRPFVENKDLILERFSFDRPIIIRTNEDIVTIVAILPNFRLVIIEHRNRVVTVIRPIAPILRQMSLISFVILIYPQ